MKRLSLRKIRDALRRSAEGLSTRLIAPSLAIGRTTIQGYLDRARDAELSWPLPPEMSDKDLPVKFHGIDLHILPAAARRTNWPVFTPPQQAYPAATVADFCTAVLRKD